MKKCNQCKAKKSTDNFYLDKRYNILRSICKDCWGINNKINNKKYPCNYKKYPFNYKKYKINYEKYKENMKDKYGLGVGTIKRYGLKLALFVYDRADRKCEQCGNKNDLTIHHKDNNGRHNKEKGLLVNNNVNNLIVLCRKCHGSIHGKQSKGIPKKMRY